MLGGPAGFEVYSKVIFSVLKALPFCDRRAQSNLAALRALRAQWTQLDPVGRSRTQPDAEWTG